MNTIFLKSVKELPTYKLENNSISNLMVGSFSLFHKGHINTIHRMTEKGNSSLIVLNRKGSHLDMFDYQEFLKEIGIKVLFIIEMSADSYAIRAFDFVLTIKEAFPNLKRVFAGSDWRFGKNREGDWRAFVSEGIQVDVVPFVFENNRKISSSIIWQKLSSQKDFNDAMPLLPFKPFTKGKVIMSHQQGRKLGFPTANITSSNSYVPPVGIYLTQTRIEGDNKLYNSITNIGYAPSINDNRILKHETHILDFDNDIYGRFIKCYYIKRIGKERKHSSRENLIGFIQEIKDEATRFFNK